MRPVLRSTISVTVLFASLAFAAEVDAKAAALLDKAEAAMRDLEYGEALKSIEAARKESNNSRATMLRVYELQGVTLATLGQDAKALKAFQSLLTLSPDFRLNGKHPPKVTTVFFEARGWIDNKKGLSARGGGSVMTPGSVKEVKVEVTNDPLKLAKEVRFHFTLDGKPKDVDVAIPQGGTTVTAPVNAPKVSWWAELLGEKDAVLLSIGSAEKPWNEVAPDAPAPVAVKPADPPKPVDPPKTDLKPAPKPDPVVAKNDPPPPPPPADKKDDPVIRSADESAGGIDAWGEMPSTTRSEPPPPTRIAGIAVAGAGVVTAGVGVVFGVMASGTAAKITGAEKDASGRIIGLTRTDALALDAQQRTQATLANILIISGAALAAGGATLIILSTRDTKVALVPQAGGAAVVGSF